MNESLAKKTVTSAIWIYLAYGLSKFANAIAIFVLTFFILPETYGIVGFAATALAFLDAVRDLGIGMAIIQRRDRIEEAANTAFWFGLASNTAIWLLSFLLAPLIANFFHEPLVKDIFPVLVFTFVINAFGSIHDALLQRDMQFNKRVLPAFFNSVFKAIISIALAYLGYGVWALVIGQVAGSFAYTVTVWMMINFRPKFQFDWGLAREILTYGYKVAFDSILGAIQANIDYVFIGRFLGDIDMGIYTLAYKIPELIIINFCIVIAQVLFPAYSSIQDDLQQLKQAVLSSLRYVSIIVIPVGVGLALVSQVFIQTFTQAEYHGAGSIMAILSLYGVFLSISWNIGDLYKAIDRADLLWKTALLELVLIVPTLYMLAQESTYHVAVGHMVLASIIGLIRLLIAVHVIELDLVETLRQFVPAVASATVMGIAVYVAGLLLSSLPNILVLVGQVLIGALTYAIALWFFERDLLMRAIDMVAWRFNSKSKQEATTE